MRIPLIAANWKMHGSRSFVSDMLTGLIHAGSLKAEVAVFPPFVFLAQAEQIVKNTPIKLGAQNLNPYSQGAYTGEISALMLQECACDYVLVGHSERRELYGETNETCVEKLIAAQTAGLAPILCVGETLSSREEGRTFGLIEQQLISVFHDPKINTVDLVLAYEPVWAIGTGRTASPEQVQEVHHFIREKVALWSGPDIAQKIRILYGGSVKADNAAVLLSQRDVDGALVGGASLVLESFLQICNSV